MKVEPVEIIFDDSLLSNILPVFRAMGQLYKNLSQSVCTAEGFQKTYHGGIMVLMKQENFPFSPYKYFCTLNMSFGL